MLIKNKIVYCFAVCLFIFNYSNALNISILVTPSTYGFGGYFYPNLVQARVGDYIIFEKNAYTNGDCRIVEANEKGSCVRSNSSDAYVVEISDNNPKASLQLTKTGKFFLIDDRVNENCINDTQCELDVGSGTVPSAKTSSANTSPAYTSAASPPGYAPATADTSNNGSSENIGLIVGIIGGGLFTLGVLGWLYKKYKGNNNIINNNNNNNNSNEYKYDDDQNILQIPSSNDINHFTSRR